MTVSGNENWKSENFDLVHLLNIQNKREKSLPGHKLFSK